MTVVLLFVLAPGTLFHSGVGEAALKMDVEGAESYLAFSRPLAILALLCPILATLARFVVSPSLSAKLQTLCIAAMACFSLLSVRCVFGPIMTLTEVLK